MKEYANRNRLLKHLGFQTYQKYLESDLWAKIRAAQLRLQPECYGCGRKATQVHHGRYTLDVMLGHAMEHLFSVCGGCHFKSEFTVDEQKLRPAKATRKLKKLRANSFWTPSKLIGTAMYARERETVDTEYKRRMDRED